MMETTSIYQDMAQRTGGSVYIGVVGPVRTGKSTFVKRFMETLVLPHIENSYRRDRAQDELPQSGSGRTIMTAEPKFVPEEAVELRLAEGAAFSVRLVDCVGYMVDSAVGQFEDLSPRMVMTPWFDHEIPMTEAAEIGTRKVITDHATVGVVVTTDGTVAELPRGRVLFNTQLQFLHEMIIFAVIIDRGDLPDDDRAVLGDDEGVGVVFADDGAQAADLVFRNEDIENMNRFAGVLADAFIARNAAVQVNKNFMLHFRTQNLGHDCNLDIDVLHMQLVHRRCGDEREQD